MNSEKNNLTKEDKKRIKECLLGLQDPDDTAKMYMDMYSKLVQESIKQDMHIAELLPRLKWDSKKAMWNTKSDKQK